MQENEEIEENIPFLTYGSIIAISHYQNLYAFICSDGHVKNNVMLRNFDPKKASI